MACWSVSYSPVPCGLLLRSSDSQKQRESLKERAATVGPGLCCSFVLKSRLQKNAWAPGHCCSFFRGKVFIFFFLSLLPNFTPPRRVMSAHNFCSFHKGWATRAEGTVLRFLSLSSSLCPATPLKLHPHHHLPHKHTNRHTCSWGTSLKMDEY